MAQSSWLSPITRSIAGVNRPAETVMVTEKHNADVRKDPNVYGNLSSFADGSIFMGDGVIAWNEAPPGYIPDGTRNPNTAYPLGPNGAVSAHHNDQANFLFCDGHSKSMRPTATNPNPKGQPSLNMWDATRQ